MYTGGHDNPTFFSRSNSGCCHGNQFLARIGENWHTPPSFCAPAFHNGREDRNVDACINTAYDPSTSDKNLVNFGPVNLEFCRRVCAGRATRWALPRIYDSKFTAEFHGVRILTISDKHLT